MSSTRPTKRIIGVVGGIGSGKSTVAAELVKLDCALIDADRIGHELLDEATVQDELRRRWGEAVFDARGRVDRTALAERVFGDSGRLGELNEIMHPRMRLRMEERIETAMRDPDVSAVVIDAAVLFEAGWDDLCTHTVFVECPPGQRLRRVRAQRGWDEGIWREREKSQKSLDTKADLCDYSISNSSSVSHLVPQIRKLFNDIVDA